MHEVINAVLIAGGPLPEDLAHLDSTGIKALAEVRGMTLLERALRAVERLDREHGVQVGEVSLVGAVPVRDTADGLGLDSLAWSDVGEHGVENIKLGLDLLETERPTLVMGTDLALVGAAHLYDFIRGVPMEAELALPLVRREDFTERFPDSPNSFERVGNEHFTLGSALFCQPAAFMRNYPLFTDAFEHRKRPHKLALLMGLDVVFKWLLGLAELEDLEARASRLCDASVSAVQGMAPELAYDIDTEQHFQFVEELEDEA